MKVAIVVNSFPEFSETFLINKVLFLAKENIDIHVLRLNPTGNKNLFELYNFANTKNVTIVDVKLSKSFKEVVKLSIAKPTLFSNLLSANKKEYYKKLRNQVLLHYFNKPNYDIIHFEFSGIAASLIEVLPHIKPKIVVSCRGSAEKVKPLTQPDRKDKLKQVFDEVNAIHCVSEDMKKTIAPYCNNLEKAFVNRPAIDVSFFTPNKLASNFNGTSILTIGRFTFQKGYLIGLLAIKKLVEKGLPIQWNIIGDGEGFEEMVFHIHTLQLQNNVFLLGKKNKNEVNNWINKSDIFLLTSVYEGIPNVVLEAMAMKLPVVTTNCGGVDEVIEYGEDGLIAPLYDSDKIAELLEIVIANKQLAKEFGENAREKILNEFSLQRQVVVFIKEYKKILNQ